MRLCRKPCQRSSCSDCPSFWATSFNDSCKRRSVGLADRTTKPVMNSLCSAAESAKPPFRFTTMLASSWSSRRQGTMSADSATLETRSIHDEMFELLVSAKTADVLCCSCLCVSDEVVRGCDAENASVWTNHHFFVYTTPVNYGLCVRTKTVIHTA